MSNSREHTWQDRLLQWWWIQLPLRTARHFPNLGLGLSDGFYLIRWPRFAAMAPPLVFLLGILLGIVHPGTTFSYSVLLMALIASTGLLGVQLGAWSVTGYAISDFLLRSHGTVQLGMLETPIKIWVPLLLSYLLLALIAVVVPIVGVLVRVQLRSWRPTQRLGILVEAAVYAAAVGTLTYLWTNAMPVLIRPVFTWQGSSPPTEAIFPLQERDWLLIAATIVVAIVRVVLERRARSPEVDRLANVLNLAFPLVHVRPRRTILARPLRILLWALALTILASGMIPSAVEGILVFLFLTGIVWVRMVMQEAEWPGLRVLMRVPVFLRFVIGLILSYFVSQLIMGPLWLSTDTFRPVLIATCLSVAILTLFTAAPSKAEQFVLPAGTPGGVRR